MKFFEYALDRDFNLLSSSPYEQRKEKSEEITQFHPMQPVVSMGQGPPVGEQRRRGRGELPVSACAALIAARGEQEAEGRQSKMWGEAKPPGEETLWSWTSPHVPHSAGK